MKNNLLFLLILLVLFVTGLGAVYYQYRFGQLIPIQQETQEEETVEIKNIDEITPATEGSAAASQATDSDLEAVPSVSEDNSLEAIEQELESTQILQEDLGDL